MVNNVFAEVVGTSDAIKLSNRVALLFSNL